MRPVRHPTVPFRSSHHALSSRAVRRALQGSAREENPNSVISDGSARRFGKLTRDDVLSFGQALGIPPKVTADHFDALRHSLMPAAVEAVGRVELVDAPLHRPGKSRTPE
jgi:hypothetical protein